MTAAEFLELARGLGAAAGPIFALLWWLERGERKDAQDELKQITKDSVVAITATEKTVEKWIAIFNVNGR